MLDQPTMDESRLMDPSPIDPAMPSSALTWTDDLVTGHRAMDTVHRSFVTVMNEAVTAPASELPARLRALEVHAQAHFDEEDALMRSTAYPSAACHLEEHAAVLKSIAEVCARVEEGQHPIGRALAAELIRWFPEHTHHMDKSLATWLFKLTSGGAPLTLQRRSTSLAPRGSIDLKEDHHA